MRRYYSGIAFILLISVFFSQIPIKGAEGTDSFPRPQPVSMLERTKEPENESQVCGDFVYELVYDGARIIKYNGGSEFLSIPAEVDGYTVVEIGSGLLNGYDGYFNGDLVIPEGVKRIGQSAFENHIFEGKLILPSTLTQIGSRAFLRSSFATGELIIPSGVQRVESEAFAYCEWIRGNLILPEGCKILENGAFLSFSDIGNNIVYIPDTVTEIQANVFAGRAKLIYGVSGSEAERYAKENGYIFVAGKISSSERNFVYELVEDGVKIIKYYADYDEYGLAIPIPSFLEIPGEIDGYTVTEIAQGTLAGYNSFVGGVFIPEGVKRIGEEVFAGKGFEGGELGLPSSLTYIGERAFDHSTFLYEIQLIIPDGVQKIGDYAFSNCKWIKGTVILPKCLYSIGEGAFENCEGMTKVFIPDTVVDISNGVFDGIKELTIYGVSGSEAERYAKENGHIFVAAASPSMMPACTAIPTPEATVIPTPEASVIPTPTLAPGTWACGDFVYEIVEDGARLIKYNGGSESLTIPAEVDGYAVIEIAQDVLVEYSRFRGDLVIPDGVKRIGEGVFAAKIFEGKLVLPSSLTDIGERAFYNSSFDEEQLIIPDGVQKIGDYAFSDCKWIRGNMILPEGLYSIGESAFASCQGMGGAGVFIPGTVVDIKHRAFGGTMALTIYGVSGSEAERYAKENGYAFVAGEIPGSTPAPSPVLTSAPSVSPSEQPPQVTPLTPFPSDDPLLEPAPTAKMDDKTAQVNKKTTSRGNKVTRAGEIKKMKAPVFSLKKKRTASGKRYVSIHLKRYKGTYLEIWVGRNAKGSKKLVYNKLKIKRNNIRKAKGIFNFQYTKQKGTLVFQIRTYMKKGKKRIYSEMSKGKGIRLS